MAKKTKREVKPVVKLLPMVVEVFQAANGNCWWEIINQYEMPRSKSYKSRRAAKRAGERVLARTKVAK